MRSSGCSMLALRLARRDPDPITKSTSLPASKADPEIGSSVAESSAASTTKPPKVAMPGPPIDINVTVAKCQSVPDA